MFCPKCGAENSPQSRFCRHCGFDIKSSTVLTARAGELAAPEPTRDAASLQMATADSAGRPATEKTAGLLPESGSIPVHAYAGFWLRCVAFIIDWLIIFAVISPLIFGIVFFTLSWRRFPTFQSNYGIAAIGYITAILIRWLYFAFMERSSKQGTIGKMVMGLKVTDLYGNRVSFGRASSRYFGRLISRAILGIGFLFIPFTARRQALHDILAGTLVMKK